MNGEVGKDVGGTIGNFLEVDKDPGNPIKQSTCALKSKFSWTNLFAEEVSFPVQRVGSIGFIISMRGFLRFVSGVVRSGMMLSIAWKRR